MSTLPATMSFKTLNKILVTALLAVTVIGIGSGIVWVNKINDLNADWQAHERGAGRKSIFLGLMRGSLGYGGMIHNLKNYVLRGDPFRLIDFQKSLLEIKVAISGYRTFGHSEQEKAALADLEAVLEKYQRAAADAEILVQENTDPRVVDRQIIVNDTPAVAALRRLDNAVVSLRQKNELSISSQSAELKRTAVVLAGGFSLFLILLTIILGWISRYRLVVPLERLVAAFEGIDPNAPQKARLPIGDPKGKNELDLLAGAGNRFLEALDNHLAKRKQAEEAVRESEEYFRTLFQGSGDSILLINSENGRIKDANDEACMMLGYSRDELLGTTFGAIHPHDFEQASKFIDKVKRHGKDRTEDLCCRTKSGTIIPAEVSAAPVIAAGTPSILIHVRDITERKNAEAALKTSEARLTEILDIAPEAVITVGTDMNIQIFNQGAERIFGYGADEVLGRPLNMLIPKRSRKDHHKHIEGFDNSGDTYRLMGERQEISGLRKDGTEFPATASVSKLEIDGEKIFTVMLQDITARKQAEDALIAATKKAEEASHAKSEFLAVMSHDLRTPLNAIIGFADILSNQYFGPIDDKYREYAEDIQSSGEHLLTLVNEILDLSVIEAGKQSLVKEKLSTMEIVRECAKIVEDKALSNGIDLVTEVPEGLPPLYADKRASKQILLNLLSNAVKFTPEGGKVTVSAKGSRKNTTLKVSDTGMGIPADELQGLTDPFTRGGHDPYLAEKGWGLGLTITKSLVELHDGTLDIKSKVGEGTTVTVTFPNGVP